MTNAKYRTERSASRNDQRWTRTLQKRYNRFTTYGQTEIEQPKPDKVTRVSATRFIEQLHLPEYANEFKQHLLDAFDPQSRKTIKREAEKRIGYLYSGGTYQGAERVAEQLIPKPRSSKLKLIGTPETWEEKEQIKKINKVIRKHNTELKRQYELNVKRMGSKLGRLANAYVIGDTTIEIGKGKRTDLSESEFYQALGKLGIDNAGEMTPMKAITILGFGLFFGGIVGGVVKPLDDHTDDSGDSNVDLGLGGSSYGGSSTPSYSGGPSSTPTPPPKETQKAKEGDTVRGEIVSEYAANANGDVIFWRDVCGDKEGYDIMVNDEPIYGIVIDRDGNVECKGNKGILEADQIGAVFINGDSYIVEGKETPFKDIHRAIETGKDIVVKLGEYIGNDGGFDGFYTDKVIDIEGWDPPEDTGGITSDDSSTDNGQDSGTDSTSGDSQTDNQPSYEDFIKMTEQELIDFGYKITESTDTVDVIGVKTREINNNSVITTDLLTGTPEEQKTLYYYKGRSKYGGKEMSTEEILAKVDPKDKITYSYLDFDSDTRLILDIKDHSPDDSKNHCDGPFINPLEIQNTFSSFGSPPAGSTGDIHGKVLSKELGDFFGGNGRILIEGGNGDLYVASFVSGSEENKTKLEEEFKKYKNGDTITVKTALLAKRVLHELENDAPEELKKFLGKVYCKGRGFL